MPVDLLKESSSPVDGDEKPAVDLMPESSLQVDEDETPVVTQHLLTSEEHPSIKKWSGLLRLCSQSMLRERRTSKRARVGKRSF